MRISDWSSDVCSSDLWHVMFATANGNVRRNKLSDFVSINVNGKIAMKLDEGDSLVGVATCSEADHVLLATSKARCIRFPVDDVRVFVGRTSSGIRGIALGPEERGRAAGGERGGQN